MIRTKLFALGSAAFLISSALACSDSSSDGAGGSGASASTGTSTGGNTSGTSTGGGNSTTGTASGGGSAAGGGNAGGGSAAGGNGTGGEAPIVEVLCPAFTDPLECGDTIDNDGDGLIDWQDPECLGPCDDTEDSFENGIPGDNNAPCKQDCYFDSNSGDGNDDCQWDHRCDPNSDGDPDFYPQPHRGDACEYDPEYNIKGQIDCDAANAAQSTECLDVCRPLLPNGCDCFGCCEIFVPNTTTSYTVWLGSAGVDGDTACGIEELANPDICHPCAQVPSCLNTCEECEICIGKPEPGPECNPGSGGGGQGGNGAGGGGGGEQCPEGVQACGLPGQAQCPLGSVCITGCCLQIPE